MDFKKGIANYFAKEKAVIDLLDMDELNGAMGAIYDAWQRGANIYTMGNGGSAATASHMVCDFNKGISMATGRRFRLTCLSDNVPVMMAIANDLSYEDIFLEQLRGVVAPGDLVIAISGSGNSANIIKAAEYAQSRGAKVVGLTGYNGGKLKALADYSMHVPVEDMQIAEDLHMVFDHMMMRIFCGCR